MRAVFARGARGVVGVAACTALLALGGIDAAAEHGPLGTTHLVSRADGVAPPPAATTNDSQLVGTPLPPGFEQFSSRTVSANGQFVVFASDADGLSTADNNNVRNVYRRNLATDVTELVSRATDGTPADGNSYHPTISPDGTTVAFVSASSTLGSSYSIDEVYLHNFTTGTTTVVSKDTTGADATNYSGNPSISVAGGTVRVAFDTWADLAPSDTNNMRDVYVRDVTASTTTLLSALDGSATVPGDDHSTNPELSEDGTRVVFESAATNLVSGDTNGVKDVFTRTLGTTATVRVSVSTASAQGNGKSEGASISSDGGKVAFTSEAANLDAADSTSDASVFVRDLGAATTVLASRIDGPTGAPLSNSSQASISGDGASVAFTTSDQTPGELGLPANGGYKVYLRTLLTGTTRLVSRADGVTGDPGLGDSSRPAVNSDGTKVAFESRAPNFSSASDGDFRQVFLRDTSTPLTPTTTLVSRPTGTSPFTGTGINASANTPKSISQDGRYVLFSSEANWISTEDDNRVRNVFVRDTLLNKTILVSRASGQSGAAGDNSSYAGGISGDGTRVSFTSAATNLVPDDPPAGSLYVRNLSTHTTTLVNTASPYGSPLDEGSSLLSGDGTQVAFLSYDNLVAADSNFATDVYVKNADGTGMPTLVSRANTLTGVVAADGGSLASISGDGTKVVFTTNSDLDAADTNGTLDVYVRDVTGGTTTLVSRDTGASGAGGNGYSYGSGVSDDGNRIVFTTASTNLPWPVSPVPNTPSLNVYVRDVSEGQTILVDRANGSAGDPGNGNAWAPAISGDGMRVAFGDDSDNLDPGKTSYRDRAVYLRDLIANTTSLVSKANGTASNADGESSAPSISANGHCVAFQSFADDLAAGFPAGTDFTNVYVRTVEGECPIDYPDTTIATKPSTFSNSKTPSFTFTADEPGSSFECRLVPDPGFTACTSSYTTPALSDGSHTLEVRAVDPAGYPDASPASWTWTIDSIAPDTTVTAGPTGGPVPNRGASFTFASADAGATFACSLDGAAFAECASPHAYSGLADGGHTFAVRAIDLAGNADPSPATRSWTIDATGPNVNATVPKQKLGSVLASGLRVVVRLSEGGHVEAKVLKGSKVVSSGNKDRATAGPTTFRLKLTSSARRSLKGARSVKLWLRIYAKDALGNGNGPWTIPVNLKR